MIWFFLDMSIRRVDSYASQISKNIFKLDYISLIDLNVEKIFNSFNQPTLTRFYEQHQKLGMDMAPFVFSMLVHAAMMLDGVDIFNPEGTGCLTGMNLFFLSVLFSSLFLFLRTNESS